MSKKDSETDIKQAFGQFSQHFHGRQPRWAHAIYLEACDIGAMLAAFRALVRAGVSAWLGGHSFK